MVPTPSTSSSQQATSSSSITTPFVSNQRISNRTPPSRSQNSLVDSSHNRSRTIVHPHQVDHNYGEPGPSTLRTRGMISRHQRNADELDALDTLHNQQPTSSSRARMIRTGPNPNENIRIMQRRTKSRGNFSEESQEIGEDDLDESENNKKIVGNDNDISDNSDKKDGDSSNSSENDSDDDMPLKMMVPSSRRSRLHNTRSGGVSKKRYFSDEEHVRTLFFFIYVIHNSSFDLFILL